MLSCPPGPYSVTGTTCSKTRDLLLANMTFELSTGGSGGLFCSGGTSGCGGEMGLPLSEVSLCNSSLCSLVQPFTPHCLVDPHLLDQCRPKQRKHNPCSLTFSNLSRTDSALNLGQFCSLWCLESPMTHGTEGKRPRGRSPGGV